MNNTRIDHFSTLQPLASTLALGFKFLAWINGMGVVAVLLFGTGIIQVDLAPVWMRLPLAAFLGGLTFAALGLLWAYPAQASLLNQLVTGRSRRTHWIPLFCTMVAYSLALFAFAAGSWLLLGLVGAVYQSPGNASSDDEQGIAPSDQSGEARDFIFEANENTVRFF
ncbi:MAG TPA: hypothetical protein VL002_04125 [Candidimonas sp.]|nr:hypothetical protein [Candidimonas sp.]